MVYVAHGAATVAGQGVADDQAAYAHGDAEILAGNGGAAIWRWELAPIGDAAILVAMEYPAFWAWHDHSRASRLAHGAVYATYVGTWRKRLRITAGERQINRFEEKETGAVRSFCRCCGTPLIYERTRSRHMINIPRALFQTRTGRQPIYHIAS